MTSQIPPWLARIFNDLKKDQYTMYTAGKILKYSIEIGNIFKKNVCIDKQCVEALLIWTNLIKR